MRARQQRFWSIYARRGASRSGWHWINMVSGTWGTIFAVCEKKDGRYFQQQNGVRGVAPETGTTYILEREQRYER